MLIKLTCVAIVIAIACIQFGYGAEELKKETEAENGQRNKRALYYQNDLQSNIERQLRAQYPLGVGAAYDYGVLPAYDYYYYDYLADPFYPIYPIYPFYDYYYDYLYNDYLFPLSAKKTGAAAPGATGAVHQAAGTRNLAGQRKQGMKPLSHHQGHPQAFAHMTPQHQAQHQSFGTHMPHHFNQPAGYAPMPSQQSQYGRQAAAPSSAGFFPKPPSAAASLFDAGSFDFEAPPTYLTSKRRANTNDKFNAIKLASSKGNSRNIQN